jgi:hypothetical protein
MWKNIKRLNKNAHKEIHYESNRQKVKIKKKNLHDCEVFFKDLKGRLVRGRGSLVGL